ncbi:ATP-binding protein [Bacteroidota bacterium]
MIKRRITKNVLEALEIQDAVALLGPRQAGKTTLAHIVKEKMPSIYLDLESTADRNKLSDPELFLRAHADKLVILDEIHRMPEIFQPMRGLIDEGRRNGNRNGRFLILGSAAIDLLRQSSETLAGRISYIHMHPFDVLEVESDLKSMNELWLRGGFPDSYLAQTDPQSFALRRNFIRTYLERDVSQFGPRIPSETLERLWTMLAHNQGTLLNSSRLAAGLSVSSPTVTSYVDLLTDLLLVRRLMPYHKNVGKRLVKSPKTYVRDSGLLHALLGIQDTNTLAGHPVVGSSWEGFVIENILAAAPEHAKASFYRTSNGAEMDLVLELGGSEGTWAIEVKRGLSPRPEKGFYNAMEDIKPNKTFIVYSGDEQYPLNADVEVTSLLEMMKKLSK